jgi:predicted dehydrogenase
MPPTPLSIGLVGAGPWARMVYAPTIANHPDAMLAGVWARRPEASESIANRYGTQSFARFEELLERCDAVAFAVPPDVQSTMALQASQAGKALLLEKPLGLRFQDAQELAASITATGVVSQLMLTWRYTETVRSFIHQVQTASPQIVLGARAHFVTASCLEGEFATPWRKAEGPLIDLGPHVFDTLDAALGRIINVRAHGNLLQWVGVLLEHESGVHSEVSLCGHSRVSPERSGAEVYTKNGVIEIGGVDGISAIDEGAFVRAVSEFAHAVKTNTPHMLDAQRGLHIAGLIEDARQQLTSK